MSQEGKIKRARVQKIVLNTILAAGLISVAVLAPNALQALKIFDGGRKRKKTRNMSSPMPLAILKKKGIYILEKPTGGHS